MATFAPSAARRFAMAAPMPRDPPVTSAIFPSSFLVIVFSPVPRISLSLAADIGCHVGCGSAVFAAYFDKLGPMLCKHGNGNGIATPSLFCGGCRGRGSDWGGPAKTAHVTAIAQPADSRS